eukprot:scaffold28166_cov112-Isochrysis_galbana.AAC.4
MRYGAVCVCGVWCVGGAMWARRVPPSLATARLPPRTESTQQHTERTQPHRTKKRRERERDRWRVARRTPERSLPRRDPPEPPGPKPEARAPLSTLYARGNWRVQPRDPSPGATRRRSRRDRSPRSTLDVRDDWRAQPRDPSLGATRRRSHHRDQSAAKYI